MGKTEIFTSAEDKAANLARHGGSVETADYRYMPKFSGTQAVEQQPRRGVVSTFINKAGSILSQAPKVVGKVVGAIGGYAVKEVAELPGEFYRTATKVLPTML